MTLTQTAILTKQLILVSTITMVLGISSFTGYKTWHAYYLAHLPPVEEKPDTKFGLLPQLSFPESNVSTSNFTYSLDTVTGGLPKVGFDPGFEKIIKVYFINKTVASLLSSEKSSALAEKFGIFPAPEVLSETKYQFSGQDKNLLVDLDSGNFSFSNEATISARASLDDDNKLVSDFKQTLSTLGALKDDLKNGRNKIILFKVITGELIPAQLRSEAIAAQISIWPDQINKNLIFTSNFDKSPVNAVVVGGADRLDNYLSLDFTYFPVDTSTFATYPLKPAEAAFNDLKSGKGVVIREPDKPQVSITSVYLGYFLPDNYSPYLQPVFVFEGPNFVAYVSAISSPTDGVSGQSQPQAR